MSTRKTAKQNPISKWLAAGDTSKLRSFVILGALSASLVGLQLGVALFNAPVVTAEKPHAYSALQETVPMDWTWRTGRYWRLLNWDSYHYFEIMQRGYHAKLPLQAEDVPHFKTTGPFLPGYPLLGRAVKSLLPVPPETALLVASQLAACIFWFYLLLWFRLIGLAPAWQALLTLLIWSYPSSFFLIAGYSEATFCAAMLGTWYWMERTQRATTPSLAQLAMTAAHSLFFGITRIFSAPILLYPTTQALWMRRSNQLWILALLAIPGLAGIALWSRYLDFKLGIPNAFYELQRVAYGHHIEPFAFLNPSIYVPRFFQEVFAVSFNRIMAAFCWLWFIIAIVTDQKPKRRLPLYALIFGLHWIGIATKAHSQLDGVARYSLPVFVLLLMVSAERLVEKPRRLTARVWAPSLILAAVFWGLQIWTALRLMRGHWIT